MARTNKKGELFSHLTQLAVLRDSATTTTLNGAVNAGATALVLTSGTGFADQDLIRVSSGESMEILRVQGAPSGNNITSAWGTGRAIPTGEAVVKQTLTDLGHLTDDGVKMNIAGDDNVVNSAIRRLAVAYLPGHMEMIFEAMLEGTNVENIATALGIKEASITGSGTTAAPQALFLDGTRIREENDLAFQAIGVRKDGQIFTVQFLGVELDFTALSMALQRGQPATVPLRGRCTSGVRILQNT